MRTIEITVSPQGESRVETSGFVGDSCREASKYIEAALGKADSEVFKSEFHQQQTLTQDSVENSSSQI